jgi:hypothetical protein
MRASGSTIFFFDYAYRSDSYEKEIGGESFLEYPDRQGQSVHVWQWQHLPLSLKAI